MKIDGSAFEGCTNLKNLTVDEANPLYTAKGNCVIHKESKQLIIGGIEAIIPSDGSVTSIGGSAFRGRGCQHMAIPNGIESIGFGAFAECSSLANITLPWTLKEIGNYVFFKCTSLKSVSVPFSVTQVGSNLFEGCTSLNTLYLSPNLKEIGDGMLCDCESFSEIHFDGTVAQWQAIRDKVHFATWEQTCPEFGVICTDGTVVMPGNS